MKKYIFAIVALLAVACAPRLKDGEYTLTVLSTDDMHGSFFDSTYAGGGVKRSLMAMNYYIDSVRTAQGRENVILVDAGDCLQGDDASYYFNFVDTTTTHVFSRMMDYMDYDAVAIGNHDVETGHPVYDRVEKDLKKAGIPLLGGNYIRDDNGKPYFPLYTVVRRSGLKVLIIGYGNANIKAWLPEELWSGMHFVPVMETIQADVDALREKLHPDAVVVVMHCATGNGDGSILEAEAMDAFNSVSGIDFLVCGHDHRPFTEARDTGAFLNSGSHSRYVAQGKMHFKVEDGKIVGRSYESNLIRVKAEMADPAMRELFHPDYEAVKAFTLAEVGSLGVTVKTRDAFAGMSPYINLIHTICLGATGADISFEAPLTYNKEIPEGPILFKDLFTFYPFENQLYLINMTGEDVLRYLEFSYDMWINTVSSSTEHVLKIKERDDPRTQQKGWSFTGRTYNFSSAGGINYTVDVTKPMGERVNVSSMADGTPFEPARTYKVAVTSYRANGGGGHLQAAGIDTGKIGEITVGRYPEIRIILYNYLKEHGSIDLDSISDYSRIGSWSFVPENIARPAIERDMKLVFGEK
ncbi:MAG: bifunctional metallophosphatase/5'-nucleotidase [Bacteroidales bacterium]|nr:bifunctional metallophosphatase/5'-nucleotidase [Bacteroidales bacterium]